MTDTVADVSSNTPGSSGGVLLLASGHTAARPVLDAVQARVLGALIEKETTTPELYPLSLNSLRSACNQSSNRHPVMELSEHEITEAIDDLKALGLARVALRPEWRAPKYRHVAADTWEWTAQQSAVMCVLLLRGQQTVGELKGRTERLAAFSDLAECEAVLDQLGSAGFTQRLPRAPGQKEARWSHLLSGPIDVNAHAETSDVANPVYALPRQERLAAAEQRVEELEARVAALEAQLSALLAELA